MQRVSDAPLSLEEDQRRRMRAYLIQMAIRLVCIFLAIFVPGVLRWVFVAGAVVLPYTAVLFANAGRGFKRDVNAFLMQRLAQRNHKTGMQ